MSKQLKVKKPRKPTYNWESKTGRERLNISRINKWLHEMGYKFPGQSATEEAKK